MGSITLLSKLQGVPLRVELGVKDLEKGSAPVTQRVMVIKGQ